MYKYILRTIRRPCVQLAYRIVGTTLHIIFNGFYSLRFRYSAIAVMSTFKETIRTSNTVWQRYTSMWVDYILLLYVNMTLCAKCMPGHARACVFN